MKRILLATCASLALPTFAYAQEVPAAPETASAPEAASSSDIVVTAQRREQRAHDVPIAVSAVGSESLEDLGIRSLSDIEKAVPGLVIGGGPILQPSLRGVSSSVANSAENNIAFYLDGAYIANQQALTAYQPDLERVEVLRGPQGTLFGRNATGGAIRFFTRGPSFTTGGRVSADVGFFDGSGASRSAMTHDFRVFLTGPIVGDQLAASISVGHQDSGTYMSDLVTGGKTGNNRRLSVRGKLLFKPIDDLEIRLTGYHQDFDDDGTFHYQTIDGLTAASAYPGSIYGTRPWEVAYEPGHNKGSIKQDGAILDIKLDQAWGTLTAQASYNKMALDFASTVTAARSAGNCLAVFACVIVDQSNDAKQHSVELNYASPQFGIFSVIAGVYYFKQISGSLSVVNNNVIGTFNDNISKALSAYGELTVKPIDALTLTAGARINRDKLRGTTFIPTTISREATYESVTPRFSIMYEFSPELNGYASYTQGFKSGLTGITNTASTPPFQPVQQERVTAYEAGFKYQTAGATFNIAAFYYDFTDKQESTFTGIANIVSNTGPVEIYGIDVDGSVRLSPEIRLRGGLSWVPKAEYKDFPNAAGTSLIRAANGRFLPGYGTTATASFDATGDRVLRAPKITANLTLNYDSGPVDASVSMSYFSEQEYALRTIKQGNYATVSLNAGYSFADSGLRLGVYARNLTSAKYISFFFGTPNAFFGGYAPPRQLGISLSYDF